MVWTTLTRLRGIFAIDTRQHLQSWNPTFLFGAILLFQFGLLAYTFPLSELFSDALMYHTDNAYHWYNLNCLQTQQTPNLLAGYDPYFSAGSIEGVITDQSAKLPALLAIALDGLLSPAAVWKLYAFVGGLVASVCLPLALLLLGQSRITILAGAVSGLLLWWTGMFRWFHTSGMVSFVFMSYASLPYLAYLANFLRRRTGRLALPVLILLASLLILIHPLFPLLVAPFLVLFLLLDYASIDIRRLLLGGGVIFVFSLLPHLGWLYHRFFVSLDFSKSYINHQRITDPILILQAMAGIWDAGGTKFNPFIVISTLYYVVNRAKDSDRVIGVCGLVGAFFLVYAQTGGYVDALARLQPNRFMPVGYLFLAVPAVVGFAYLVENLKGTGRRFQKLVALGVLGLVLAGTGLTTFEFVREVSYEKHGHYGQIPPVVRGAGEVSVYVVEVLKNHTSGDSRILFETSNALIYDGGHGAGYMAVKSNREFIGGPYTQRYFSGFWDHFLFGREIEEISHSQMREYFGRYNIGWIIVHSDRSKAYFLHMPGVVPVESQHGISIFRTDQERNFFFKGSGNVADRGSNRLVLENLKGDEVVLKYHYIPGLISEPPVQMEPIKIGDDPNPFIRLIDPPSRVELRR